MAIRRKQFSLTPYFTISVSIAIVRQKGESLHSYHNKFAKKKRIPINCQIGLTRQNSEVLMRSPEKVNQTSYRDSTVAALELIGIY